MRTETVSVSRLEIVRRFFLAGTALGLLLGLIEAPIRYFTPCVPTAKSHGPSLLIFFVAPLVNLTFMGMVGLVLGAVAVVGKRSSELRITALASLMMGVAITHLGWMHDLLQVWVADLDVIENLRAPLLWLTLSTLLAWILFRIVGVRAFTAEGITTRWSTGTWLKAMGGITALLAAGLLVLKVHAPGARAAASSPMPANPRPPNIALIMLDTVRADHLSTYGYSRPTTPFLDHLAKQGVVFENVVAPCSWTLPSQGSIFTGLLPHQHGADIFSGLDARRRTLAEILASLGYETVGVNANGFGFPDRGLEQGFSHYDAGYDSLRYNLVSTLVGKAILQPIYMRAVRPDFYFRRDAREVNAAILRWSRQRSNQPYFLFVNYFDAHDPYFQPWPHSTQFGHVSNDVMRRVSFPSAALDIRLSPEERIALTAAYDNGLAYLDDEIRRLFDGLSRSADFHNTIFIITSDHGESFGEHATYAHGRNLYYREGLHVPLIIIGPGIPQGVRFSQVVGLRELFATILDLGSHGKFPLRWKGLRRYWIPGYQAGATDEIVVSELVPFLPDFRPVMMSLMTKDWHYIRNSQGKVELYHWPTDPFETQNLAHSPDSQELLQDLHRRLAARVGYSVRPWNDVEYLQALDEPGYAFVLDPSFRASDAAVPFGKRMGSVQAIFPPDAGSAPGPLVAPDADMLRSLPYANK